MKSHPSADFRGFRKKSSYFFYMGSKMDIFAHRLSVLANDQQYFPASKTERLGRAGLYRRMARQAMKKANKYLDQACVALKNE